ncbi:hypothetical protein Taro_037279, partial [Colocasia esculenta]|nr:hypothetical protein [Colocasia esculenta]
LTAVASGHKTGEGLARQFLLSQTVAASGLGFRRAKSLLLVRVGGEIQELLVLRPWRLQALTPASARSPSYVCLIYASISFVARASLFTAGLVYGKVKLSYLKAKANTVKSRSTQWNVDELSFCSFIGSLMFVMKDRSFLDDVLEQSLTVSPALGEMDIWVGRGVFRGSRPPPETAESTRRPPRCRIRRHIWRLLDPLWYREVEDGRHGPSVESAEYWSYASAAASALYSEGALPPGSLVVAPHQLPVIPASCCTDLAASSLGPQGLLLLMGPPAVQGPPSGHGLRRIRRGTGRRSVCV